MLGNGQFKRIQNPFHSPPNKNDSGQIPPKLPNANSDTEDAILVTEGGHEEILPRYFKYEDGKLKLINSRLKESGKLDQAIRLAILTLYAYECAGQTEIEKTVFSEMLGSAKLYDTHFQRWLRKCDEILREGNKLQLSVPGREVAQKILKEIVDESVTKGSISFSKTNKSAGRKKKVQDGIASKENDAQSSSRKKKGPIYYLEQLINEGYFGQKRKLNTIIEYLRVNKAETYQPNELSTPLKRLIKSQRLKREKSADGIYEYHA